METNLQQSEAADTTSNTPIAAIEGSQFGNQPLLPPASKSNTKVEQIGTQVSEFLGKLPDNTVKFFLEYKQPIITVGLIITAIIVFRVILAILDAINDIPLVYPTFKLIGLGYTLWFVFRYLIQASTRQELAEQIRSLRSDIAGS